MKHTHAGGCHCGALSLRFETERSVDTWPVRMCTCSFCRKHAPRYTSDPMGSLVLQAHDVSALKHYAFGSKTAEFVLCGHCGTFLCAVSRGAAGPVAVLNINCLPPLPTPDPVTMDFDAEPLAQKQERRARFWTPFMEKT